MTKFLTVQERISSELRDAIRHGELEPGRRLHADQLAKDFGVSRMPVREALLKLESEGLVTSRPYRGHSVSQLSVEEIEEVFYIRCVLEPIAAAMAAPRIGDVTIGELERLTSEMEQCESDPSHWIGLDRQFHEVIYQAGGNQRLCRLAMDLRDDVERYIRTYIGKPGLIEASRARHREILNALRSRDEDMSLQATQKHLHETEAIFIAHLKQVVRLGDAAEVISSSSPNADKLERRQL